MKKILFLCSANKDRSRTAEDYFQQKFPNLQFYSAGTNQKICFQLGTEFISRELLEEVDLIYCMESKHKKFALSLLKTKKKMTVLDIPDRYTYYQQELIALLLEKISF